MNTTHTRNTIGKQGIQEKQGTQRIKWIQGIQGKQGIQGIKGIQGIQVILEFREYKEYREYIYGIHGIQGIRIFYKEFNESSSAAPNYLYIDLPCCLWYGNYCVWKPCNHVTSKLNKNILFEICLNWSSSSSRKYYFYRRPIGDLSETHRRPIGDLDIFIGDWLAPSETDMPDRRHIGDRHAPSETDMPVESNRNFNTFKYSYFLYFLLIYIHI